MLNKKGKGVVVFIILFMIIMFIYLLNNIFLIIKNGTTKRTDNQIVSNINSSNDYRVYLNENDFIDSEYLPSNSSYISSLVKYIETEFRYEYINNSNANIKYSYDIKANIDSKYNGDTTSVTHSVWKKSYLLKETTEQITATGTFKIDEIQTIDLAYYNTLIKLFREQLNLSVEASLDIRMTIYIEDGLNRKEHYMSMVMPLDVKSFDILQYKNFSDKEVSSGSGNVNAEYKYALAIFYIILLMVILVCGTELIIVILNLKKTKYKKEIDKILNNYGNRIIVVSNFMDYDKYETVDLLNFEEMLNLADETFEPIVYWEKGVGKEAWFSILRNNILYRYIIMNKK